MSGGKSVFLFLSRSRLFSSHVCRHCDASDTSFRFCNEALCYYHLAALPIQSYISFAHGPGAKASSRVRPASPFISQFPIGTASFMPFSNFDECTCFAFKLCPQLKNVCSGALGLCVSSGVLASVCVGAWCTPVPGILFSIIKYFRR